MLTNQNFTTLIWPQAPISPEVVPGPVDVAAPATRLALRVAGDEALRRHLVAGLVLDGEPVGRDGGGGEGPRRAAPALVAHAVDLARPLLPRVEAAGQLGGVVAELDCRHVLDLQSVKGPQLLHVLIPLSDFGHAMQLLECERS